MHVSHTCGLKTLISTVAQKCHGNFNLLMAISNCSRQFQFTSWQFQFTRGNFILLTAISIYSRQFFASLTTCQLQQPTVTTKSQNAKLKVDI